MGTSLPVRGEKDIDFPKHLARPDPWPSDPQVRRKSGSLNPCSQETGRECTVIMLCTINSIILETDEPVGNLVEIRKKNNQQVEPQAQLVCMFDNVIKSCYC